MKRILFLNEIGEIAGTEIMLSLIMTHLDKSRYTPIVACPEGPIVERIKKSGIEHIPFTFRMRRLKTGSLQGKGIRVINPRALVQKEIESFAIARIVKKHQIDIIHTNSLSAHVAGLLAGKRIGTPVVWHIHTHLTNLLYRFMLPDAVIFVSDAVMRAAYPKAVPAAARRIYNGIELSMFNPDAPPIHDIRAEFGIQPDQPLVVLIAHLDPIKRQDELLKAWTQVISAFPSAHLLLVGKVVHSDSAVYADRLHTIVQERGLQESVTFTGYRSDIPSILHAADVYVSFTLNEAHPLSVIEAMSMRKAIIGANSGGLPELIQPGESGILVNNSDISGLAAAIKALLSDANMRQRFGEAARQRALSQFSIETCVANIQAVYDELSR